MAGINPSNNSGAVDDFLSVSVTSDIVAVRIINTNAIDVRVMNFPGVPPPLPNSLRAPAFLPKLPGQQQEDVTGKSRDVGGMVAAIAMGGVLLKGLESVKSTFVDPFLGAAKGGFDAGVSRGAGSSVLGKSFEVLGTAVGVMLLPVIIRLSSEALALANNFQSLKKNSILGKAYDFVAGGNGKNAEGLLSGTPARIFNSMNPLTFALSRKSVLGNDFNPGEFMARNLFGLDSKAQKNIDKDSMTMQSLVIQSLKNSFGGQAGYSGITDIRGQAQLAAQQDPIERQIKELSIKALNKYLYGEDYTNSQGTPTAIMEV